MNELLLWAASHLESILFVGAAIGAVAVWVLQAGIERGWIAKGDAPDEGSGRPKRRPPIGAQPAKQWLAREEVSEMVSKADIESAGRSLRTACRTALGWLEAYHQWSDEHYARDLARR